MACQTQDLGILKLLVHEVRSKQNNYTDVEQISIIESNNWLDWLYNFENNIFLKEIMNQDSEIAKYLRRVYKEETQTDFILTDKFNSEDQASTSKTYELHDAKALHELQVLDGSFSLNLDLNSNLNIHQTLELMVFNNKKYFCSPTNIHNSSMTIISSALKVYSNEFGGKSFKKSLFQALQDSNVELVSSYIESFQILYNYEIRHKMLEFALEGNNTDVTAYLINKFPNFYKEMTLHQATERGITEIVK